MPTKTPQNDAEAVEALREMHPELDAWRARTRTPLAPEPGSALVTDDRAWTFAPLSSMAAGKLGGCVDHLQALRVLCEAESYHPSASFTLARSALLSASTVVWLLGPDDPALRQRRGMHETWENDKQARLWLRERRDTPGVIWPNLALRRGTLAMHELGMEHRLAEGLIAPGPTDGLGIVEWAARRMQPDNPAWVAQARAMWRAGSGDAHALQYATVSRAGRVVGPDPGGGPLHVFEAGGSPLQVWQHFYVAFQTVSFGWRRWDKLATPSLRTRPDSADE